MYLDIFIWIGLENYLTLFKRPIKNERRIVLRSDRILVISNISNYR